MDVMATMTSMVISTTVTMCEHGDEYVDSYHYVLCEYYDNCDHSEHDDQGGDYQN